MAGERDQATVNSLSFIIELYRNVHSTSVINNSTSNVLNYMFSH